MGLVPRKPILQTNNKGPDSLAFSGPEVIKLEFILSLTQNKVKWLAACGHVSASSQSLHFILSWRLYSSFITSGLIWSFTICIIQPYCPKNKWASLRGTLSSGFPTKRVSNQPPQLQRLAREIEISPVASWHMILSKKGITKALIRLCECAGWSATVLFAKPRRQIFSHRGPNEVKQGCLRLPYLTLCLLGNFACFFRRLLIF